MIDKVFEILKENKGKYVSGEKISSKIGVTRSAVWKYIKSLREYGYIIQSTPNKGYMLKDSPDILLPYEIKRNLNTAEIAREIAYFKSVGSTNDVLKDIMLKKQCNQGMTVIAEQQIKGKGRLGRCWVSPPYKGIWMSILLKPQIKTADAPFLTLTSAVAVAQAIKLVTGLNAMIKWPNDIVIGSKKVCGILTEVNGELDMINYVIIGIGINVNMDYKDFPDEITEKATSLKIEKGEHIARIELVKEVLRAVEVNYYKFNSYKGRKEIVDECRQMSATIGKQIKVEAYNHSFYGQAIDIDDYGRLLIKKQDGSIESLISGEVSVRGLYGYV